MNVREKNVRQQQIWQKICLGLVQENKIQKILFTNEWMENSCCSTTYDSWHFFTLALRSLRMWHYWFWIVNIFRIINEIWRQISETTKKNSYCVTNQSCFDSCCNRFCCQSFFIFNLNNFSASIKVSSWLLWFLAMKSWWKAAKIFAFLFN